MYNQTWPPAVAEDGLGGGEAFICGGNGRNGGGLERHDGEHRFLVMVS